ncbi:agmatinase [Candidatus Micrarchaeota archaeon]|nr:agmatinase [Candidatus Micrarchaeota archaeon]
MPKRFAYPHTKVPYRFAGIAEQDYEKARVVYLPVPYDGTTSYRTGAREGPHAMITASRNMETYDEELKSDFTQLGLYTTDELESDLRGPEHTIKRVREAVQQILEDRKFPFMLGGEHSLTAGALEAFREKKRKLTVLQFDAHPDMRDAYENTKDNHACVMRRALDLGFSVVQVGIRSVSEEDVETWKQYGKQVKTFRASEKESWKVEEIVRACGENVYVTFDVDALDSGVMPSTGTPEPGGLNWYETLRILRSVAEKKEWMGADVMELSPIPGLVAPDFLAARLAYKMTGYAFLRGK